MKALVNYQEHDAEMVKEIIADELETKKRFPINEIKSKYGLKRLAKHTQTITSVFGTSISVSTIIIIAVIIYVIKNKRSQTTLPTLTLTTRPPINAQTDESGWNTSDPCSVNSPTGTMRVFNKGRANAKKKDGDS